MIEDCFLIMQINSNKAYRGLSQKRFELIDNGGRRLGAERRVYCYSFHIPERRIGRDRRSGLDRRKSPRFQFKELIRESSPKK